VEDVTPPIPSWPWLFFPQHQTSPLATAQAWPSPRSIDVTPEIVSGRLHPW
jgi:hypothetical protein